VPVQQGKLGLATVQDLLSGRHSVGEAYAGTDLGEVVVLDVDATIVVSHSEKENAAPTFKGTFGFHPLGVWCDNTTELLAARLRAGNAGANTAADHIEVLAAAINQIPRAHRKHVLIRADGAGASHALLDWLTAHNEIRGRRVDYSVGFGSPTRYVRPSWWSPRRSGPQRSTLTAASVPAGMSPKSPACST
jgi:hypothetical protein